MFHFQEGWFLLAIAICNTNVKQGIKINEIDGAIFANSVFILNKFCI